MTTATAQFQRNKDLFSKWSAMAATDDFQNVLAFARASILEGNSISAEVASGVNLMADTLLALIEPEESPQARVATGLQHDLTVARQPRKKD